MSEEHENRTLCQSDQFKSEDASTWKESPGTMQKDAAAHTSTATRPKPTHKRKDGYQCKVCGESFSRALALMQHLWIHTGEKPFRCDQCDCSFNALAILHKHQRLKHNVQVVKSEEDKLGPDTYERLFKCDQCDCSFRMRKELLKHQHRNHPPIKQEDNGDFMAREAPQHNERPFECTQCGRSYIYKRDLQKHQRMRHKIIKDEEKAVPIKEAPQELLPDTDEKPFQSDQRRDGFTFSLRPKTKVKHWRNKGVDFDNECKQCGKRFSNKSKLQVHERIHTGKKIFKCNHCDAEFIKQSVLIIHERNHTGERPFVCDLCGKSFIERKYLNAHWRTSHEKTKAHSSVFTCGQCGCQFQTQSQLNTHQVQCSDNRKEKSLGITSDTEKDQSAKASDVNNPHNESFDEYGKGFASQQQLSTHQCLPKVKRLSKCKTLEVQGKGLHSCHLCNSSFDNPKSLHFHQLRRHRVTPEAPGEDKRHKCGYCGKGFKTNSHLQEHVYIHVGKPFKCEACGCSYIREKALRQHQERCGIISYRCGHCRLKFKSRYYLMEHKQLNKGKDCRASVHKESRPDEADEYSCSHCDERFSDPSGLVIHKCKDQSTEKTMTCEDCGTVVRVSVTTLSNVFTLANLSNVKCFINNHTLL